MIAITINKSAARQPSAINYLQYADLLTDMIAGCALPYQRTQVTSFELNQREIVRTVVSARAALSNRTESSTTLTLVQSALALKRVDRATKRKTPSLSEVRGLGVCVPVRATARRACGTKSEAPNTVN